MPLLLIFLSTASSTFALIIFFPAYVLLNMYISAMYSANQSLSQLQIRATATAILLFFLNMVGAGAGPFIVGALSDWFAPDYGALSIRYALITVTCAVLIGAGCVLFGCRFLNADVQRVAAQTGT